jgi:PAS domain S-box-containing protein
VRLQPQSLNHSPVQRALRRNVHSSPIAPALLEITPKKPPAMHQVDRALWGIERATDLSFANTRGLAESDLSLPTYVHTPSLIQERWDRSSREKADNFAAIFYSCPVILCIIRLSDHLCVEMNKRYEERTGYCRSEVIGERDVNLGLWNNAKERDRVFQKVLTAGRYTKHQTTFRTKAGRHLNVLLSAERMEFRGAPCVLVMAEDITKRRQAEEARLELAQRLVNAQEAECARVGRELHDNIGQSLALLSMELQETKSALAGLSRTSDARFDHLCNKVRDLGREVGNLSHQLHSSGLEFLGLATAADALCREFSERHRMKVRCDSSTVPQELSSDVSLCLFRVLQESLNNVAKHSQAKSLTVIFGTTSKLLRLDISDDGVGFDCSTAKAKRGLGLISMRERLHLAGGKLTITSRPGSGTRIEAIIPKTS